MRGLPLAGVAVVALALAGCGGGGSKSDGSGGGGTAAASGAVKIVSFKYMPASITVKMGGSLKFTNADTADHTATADASGFDTGNVRRGKSVTIHLTKAGTFAYHCDFHPFMKGTVVVK
jgi:plastocyanin